MDEYETSKAKTKRYKKIKILLKEVFGYDNFRPKQYEIINKIVSGEDVCAILSTGYGKSICFQLPALYLDKPAIIISPLISLMDDQRMILEELGISSCCLNNTVTNRPLVKKDILQCKYKFVYITPETIINLKDFLVRLHEKQGISLIAIDEAHCISSYGFDFRKAYRDLNFFKDILPDVPILAVTATATENVAKDICNVLDLKTQTPIKTSFDRPNLYLEARKKSSKIDIDIVPLVKKYDGKTIIIYCLTKKETSKVAEVLKVHGIKCGIYHAGLDSDDKATTHNQFITGKIKVIAATIAFGMGINKSDVRVVIHYGAARNIEGYYQEIGRAGRDGKKSYCYTFYSYRDFKVQENFIRAVDDTVYRDHQLKLLDNMKNYLQTTNKCRRKILMKYFDEDLPDKCNFCDNCCGVSHNESTPSTGTTEQNVRKEAKMLIELIESVKNRNFGIGMYINILRGSNNKNITSVLKKSNYYGAGKHKSVAWWKELADNLIKLGFLDQIYLKSGRFPMQVVKVKKQGLMWANMSDLSGLLDGLNQIDLKPIKMTNTT